MFFFLLFLNPPRALGCEPWVPFIQDPFRSCINGRRSRTLGCESGTPICTGPILVLYKWKKLKASKHLHCPKEAMMVLDRGGSFFVL